MPPRSPREWSDESDDAPFGTRRRDRDLRVVDGTPVRDTARVAQVLEGPGRLKLVARCFDGREHCVGREPSEELSSDRAAWACAAAPAPPELFRLRRSASHSNNVRRHSPLLASLVERHEKLVARSRAASMKAPRIEVPASREQKRSHRFAILSARPGAGLSANVSSERRRAIGDASFAERALVRQGGETPR